MGITDQARRVRRMIRRMSQMRRYRLTSLDGVPIFFANSFPKSGTHLLTQVLTGFTYIGPAVVSGLPAVVTFEGESGRARSLPEILADLGRLLPGDISYGHLHAQAEIVDLLCRNGFATYFIMRDPRDVVVSHVHYVTEMAINHIHHGYYKNSLRDFDQRLETSIIGIPDAGVQVEPMPDINQRFAPYTGWLNHPEVLCIRYEDFIEQRLQILALILDHAIQRGFQTNCNRETAIQILDRCINPHKSPTFRSGKTGEWRQVFSTENKRIFKQLAAELLIQLSYEHDDNW